MTLHAVGTTNKYRLTTKDKNDLKSPLNELELTHVKELSGAQVTAAIALDVAESIPGESQRLREAIARFNQQK